MTAEQLEAARSERMRHNGHAATQYEDIRTWIEETGLCLFLPRSVQASFTAPTFVEAIAGRRVTEPNLDLVGTADQLLVRLEAEGVAVRLSLNGQPGDQPDYVVASWVLPYVYALRGDRDWRRPPQLTGSRQVSQLAVQVAKQLETGNQSAPQLRDALGREVTESATLRALHELWRQLRVIPVVPEPGKPALWQPLRQRFQKAIAEGASTSQVTAISVLASIYLQAVIAASMEDVEMFLAALTSRSKIREVVRGLAATRQVHTTTLGQLPLYYVAGTLPEFPAEPSYAISGSSYLNRYQRFTEERETYTREPVSLAAFAERQRPSTQSRDEHAHSDPHAGSDQADEADQGPAATSNDSQTSELRPAESSRKARPATRPHATATTRGDRVRNVTDAHPRQATPARNGSRPTSADARRNRPTGASTHPGKKVARHARPAAAAGRFQSADKPAGFAPRKPGERSSTRPAGATKIGAAKPATRFGNGRPATKASDRSPARTSDGAPVRRTTEEQSSSRRPGDRRADERRPADRRTGSHASASKRYSLAGASARQSSHSPSRSSSARSASARPASSRSKSGKPTAGNRSR